MVLIASGRQHVLEHHGISTFGASTAGHTNNRIVCGVIEGSLASLREALNRLLTQA
jgi:hypothetical protein